MGVSGGISIPKSTGVTVPKPGKIPAPKIPTPRPNPTGYHLQPRGFPRVTPPRIKPQSTRMYNKSLASPDPGLIPPGGGFGATGMTGES